MAFRNLVCLIQLGWRLGKCRGSSPLHTCSARGTGSASSPWTWTVAPMPAPVIMWDNCWSLSTNLLLPQRFCFPAEPWLIQCPANCLRGRGCLRGTLHSAMKACPGLFSCPCPYSSLSWKCYILIPQSSLEGSCNHDRFVYLFVSQSFLYCSMSQPPSTASRPGFPSVSDVE